MKDSDLPYSGDALGSGTNRIEEKTSVLRNDRLRPPAFDLPEELPSLPRNTGALELGHYDVLETIGRGGFGVVVKAFDQKLQRIVAVKMMAAELATTSPARKRFVREARAGAAVRHENVVRIYAVEEQPIPYLVMEYVPGESLQELLDRTGPLGVAEVLRIGAQIARGLAAAHATGLVHRDIKPANVLLEEGELPQVKLTDFGLARAADDASLSQSGMVVGTPMYMAPEQARGDSFDHRADLYSLGSVLYVMTSGRPPFRAPNTLAVLKRVADENPRPIQEIIPETPKWLCDIIGKLHARNPDERYQSAQEVAVVLGKALAELQRGEPVVGIAPPPPVERLRVSPRGRWRKAVAAGLLVCATVVAGFAAFRPEASPEVRPNTPPSVPATPAKPEVRPGGNHTNVIGMEFVTVPRGKALLSGGAGVAGTRAVEFDYEFQIGKYEVTREEWGKVMFPRTDVQWLYRFRLPSPLLDTLPAASLPRLPIEWLTWDDCQEFLRKLNQAAGETGWVYRLPTADEWEYACRNGPNQSPSDSGNDFYAGEPSTELRAESANFAGNGLKRLLPVGSFPPNRLGIHDMHGNIFEFLDDAAGESGEARLIAGGFWEDAPFHCRASAQPSILPTSRMTGSGLRLVRVRAEHAVTPRQEVESVLAELRALNPDYKGKMIRRYSHGHLVGLYLFDAEFITNITPVAKLRRLEVFESWGGGGADLGPLKGLPLRELAINNSLTVRDLSPLNGMPLERLSVWGFQGNDLSPLQGMKLTSLNCGGGLQKLDLAPLKGMPLTYLCVNSTQVSDLSPLQGMPLQRFLAVNTHVSDLSPLRGMKLKEAQFAQARVTDPSPVLGMPLEVLHLDFDPARDTELVRSFSKLTSVNGKPPAEFLKEFESK